MFVNVLPEFACARKSVAPTTFCARKYVAPILAPTTCFASSKGILEEKAAGFPRKLQGRHLRSLGADLPPFY
ncbi:hypothetical protein JTE90_020572 [Oedothorax gibbosus]|uniref:Uncharacterized protein n=1 Tax=Oedothorax gibbosus TaxID=931172 RepID=A0AAV6VXY7_9ARAC|nr:hypothetical protein JTE90_020572 [Oedothorax gibbosus]